MRIAGLALVAACSFEHGILPGSGTAGDGGSGSGSDSGSGSGSGSMADAAVGTACFGPASGAWRVCLGTTPAGSVSLPATLDTDTSSFCLGAQPDGWLAGGQPAACFVVGGTISTDTTSVTGSRPLVLVAAQSITLGTLDVASHVDGKLGPGAQPSACASFVHAPLGDGDGWGGGAGGSFMARGGDGGAGNGGQGIGGIAAAADTLPPALLRGGCRGQLGGNRSAGAGEGGGAVYVVAGTMISINGAINASGAGGGGGSAPAKSGGNGGGSGGMIALHAGLSISLGGSVFANGGGGGGGRDGSSGTPQPGEDPSLATTPAQGGSGPGGRGGNGYAALTPATSGSTNDGGGGAGGGGAGYIRANTAVSGIASPAVAIVP